MEFTGEHAESRLRGVTAAAAGVVVGLDFDGVLAPIVDDPAQALIHPGAAAALTALAPHVAGIAVITGRPARQAVALGGLDELGATLAESGSVLEVFGQYGNERWSALDRAVRSPRPPAGLATFARDLPALLRAAGAAEAFVEEKGLAVAVHTRRLADPEAAFARLLPVLDEAAARRGLVLEPGRLVIEVRAPGTDKGDAVRTLVAERGATGFVYVGDDLGDLPAFAAVAQLREEGAAGLLVCSASEEQNALVGLADVVVAGPAGVVELLTTLARQMSTH